jgi:APA family basic amino acid/polyamine antiporter
VRPKRPRMSGDDDASGLRRGLGLPSAVSIVVGTVIGTGIFLKTALMAQLLGSAAWVLAAWVAAGLLSLAGTLTYAELAAMMPQAGGPYVYLKAAYGKLPAFFFGWKELLSTKGASNAAVSMAIAIFLTQLLPVRVVWTQRTLHLFHENVTWQFGSQQLEAIALIIILSAINCLGVRAGGAAQTVLTGAKLLGIAFLVIGAFAFSHGSWRHFLEAGGAGTTHVAGLSAFGAAMIAALWAYSGWGDLIIAAGEVRHPGRTIPRGLIVGIGIVIIVYVVTNAAYIFALPLQHVADANSTAFPNAPPVAARVAAAFLGAGGAAFLSLLFVVSALGTLNGGILTGSRIPFAMAQDGQMPASLAALHPKTRAPVRAIVLLGAWACLLTLTGTFDQLTTLVIFVDILLDAIGVMAIFILRRSMAGAHRPYRTPLYPWVPALYATTLIWLVANTVWTNPLEVAGGLGLLAAGLPVYLFFRAKDKRRPELTPPEPTVV